MSNDAWRALYAQQLVELNVQVEEIRDFQGLIASVNRDEILETLLGHFGRPDTETFRKRAKVYLALDGYRTLGDVREFLTSDNISRQHMTKLLRPLKKQNLVVPVRSTRGHVYRRFAHDQFIGLSDKLVELLGGQ